MSRITAFIEAKKQAGRKLLIPYITAGDSNKDMTVPLMHAMVEAGSDIIELGIPFSDPMCDGPTIQLACERALVGHTSTLDVLAMVSEFRQTNTRTPVVLMGYLNPIEVLGYERFAQKAQEVGVDGVLLVDMPPEETSGILEIFRSRDIDTIFLIAPTSTEARIKKIAQVSTGYVYYVSVKGVTGANTLDVVEVETKLNEIRRHSNIPIGVGFGIKDGATAAAVTRSADGAIVGSAIVNIIASNTDNPEKAILEVKALVKEIRDAIDA